MRYTVMIFDPLNEDTGEGYDTGPYTLRMAREFADRVIVKHPNAIAVINDERDDWADERVGPGYDAACLRRRREDASR